MAYNDTEQPRLVLRFSEARQGLTAIEVANVLGGFNSIYELTALTILPGYEDAYIPMQIQPRKYSRLARPDQLSVDSLRYGSPLEFVFTLDPAAWASAGATGLITAFPAAVGFMKLRDQVVNRHTRDQMLKEQLDANLDMRRRANEAAYDDHLQAKAQVRLTEAQTHLLQVQSDEILHQRRVAAAFNRPRSGSRRGDAGSSREQSSDHADRGRSSDQADAKRGTAAVGIGESLDRISAIAGLPDVEYVDPTHNDA